MHVTTEKSEIYERLNQRSSASNILYSRTSIQGDKMTGWRKILEADKEAQYMRIKK